MTGKNCLPNIIKPITVLVHEYGICIVNIIHCIVNVLSLNISSDLSQLTHMYILHKNIKYITGTTVYYIGKTKPTN